METRRKQDEIDLPSLKSVSGVKRRSFVYRRDSRKGGEGLRYIYSRHVLHASYLKGA